MSTISKWVLGHILLRWVCWSFSSCSSCLLMLTVLLLHWMEYECYWFHTSLLMSYLGACNSWSCWAAGVIHARVWTVSFLPWIFCKKKFRYVRPELGLTVSATWGNGAASALIIKEVERSKSRIAFAARRQAQVDFHLCWRTLGLQHRNVQASACLLDLSN